MKFEVACAPEIAVAGNTEAVRHLLMPGQEYGERLDRFDQIVGILD